MKITAKQKRDQLRFLELTDQHAYRKTVKAPVLSRYKIPTSEMTLEMLDEDLTGYDLLDENRIRKDQGSFTPNYIGLAGDGNSDFDIDKFTYEDIGDTCSPEYAKVVFYRDNIHVETYGLDLTLILNPIQRVVVGVCNNRFSATYSEAYNSHDMGEKKFHDNRNKTIVKISAAYKESVLSSKMKTIQDFSVIAKNPRRSLIDVLRENNVTIFLHLLSDRTISGLGIIPNLEITHTGELENVYRSMSQAEMRLNHHKLATIYNSITSIGVEATMEKFSVSEIFIKALLINNM